MKQRRYTAVMALSIENVANWEVNISGYCSHIISVIGKKKLKKKKQKESLEPDSNLTRDLKLTRATNKLLLCSESCCIATLDCFKASHFIEPFFNVVLTAVYHMHFFLNFILRNHKTVQAVAFRKWTPKLRYLYNMELL